MRLLIVIFLFFVIWAGSSYWYVCKIKCLCPVEEKNTTVIRNFEVKSNQLVIVKQEAKIKVKRNNPIPFLPESIYNSLDTVAQFLNNNPGKFLQINSFFTQDELVQNPNIGIDRGSFIAQWLKNKLIDSTQVRVRQTMSENLFFNNEALNPFEYEIMIDPNTFTSTSVHEDSTIKSLKQKKDSLAFINNMIINAKKDTTQDWNNNNKKVENKEIKKTEIAKIDTSKLQPIKINIPSNEKPQTNKVTLLDWSYIIKENTEVTFYPNPDIENIAQQIQLLLKANPKAEVLILGHTCNTNNQEINMALSSKNAKSFAKVLQQYNIPKAKIKTIGKGSSNPIYENDTEENKEKNRRIQIQIIN